MIQIVIVHYSPLKDQFGKKEARDVTIDLFKGLKKIVSIGILVDFPTRLDFPTRRGESFFDYKYLREFEAKIGTARNVV